MQFGNPQRATVAQAESTQRDECHEATGRETGCSGEGQGAALSGLQRCVHTWDSSSPEAMSRSHME